jgi:deazaflavin-dependent oxidoreductase (nitroreductase family)
MALEGEYEPSPVGWVREQVELYESSNGEQGNTLLGTGMPVVIVTNRGVKSGKLRKTPLMRVEHDGDYLAVASQGGSPKHPVWYFNLLADPRVELRDREQVREMTARLVEGEERALWWDRAVAAYPPYRSYQERTEREIPVFVLEPVAP